MAKKTTETLSGAVENEANIRAIRDSEKQRLDVANKLKQERAKRKQCETDLDDARRRLAQFEETAGSIKSARVPKRTRRKGDGSATAVLCCNDWHAEEHVDPAVIDDSNEFNLDIAERRIKKLWERAAYLTEFARGISNVRDLVIWLGGDLINGTIHEELEESNFLGPADAILWVQQHVADGIRYLKKNGEYDSITVVTSYGNHGRSTRRRRISTGYKHSWEWLAYNNLAGYFSEDPTVTFKIEKGYHNWLEIQGFMNRFHHGDAVRFHGGVGGVGIPLKKKIAQWDKRRRADYDWVGHFHQFEESWKYVLCGCLVGYNAYAIEIGAEWQPPTQTFGVLDRKLGKVLATPIFVDRD